MNKTGEIICTACGTQYHIKVMGDMYCPICRDDRQFVPENGQSWVSPDDLAKGRAIQIRMVLPDVYDLTILPSFAIGQRAFLICARQGNILWDCIPLLDESTEAFIRSKGGLKAIAISHPHYYSNMLTWAKVFNCTVYIHAHDRWWAPESPSLALWHGVEKQLWNGMNLINTGGHFPGSAVLYVPSLSGRDIIFSADSLFISKSLLHISVMYSYPNLIPLPVTEIKRICNLMEACSFDAMYGAFPFQNLTDNVMEIWRKSMRINTGEAAPGDFRAGE